MSAARHRAIEVRPYLADFTLGDNDQSPKRFPDTLMQTGDLPHVLVVGEDAEETSVICASLTPALFRCTSAVGSRQALAIARETAVDVALLDVSQLRPQDGLLMARRLRDEGRDPGVVLIA